MNKTEQIIELTNNIRHMNAIKNLLPLLQPNSVFKAELEVEMMQTEEKCTQLIHNYRVDLKKANQVPVQYLGFSKQTEHTLLKARIDTLEFLMFLSPNDLRRVKGMERKSYNEINFYLGRYEEIITDSPVLKEFLRDIKGTELALDEAIESGEEPVIRHLHTILADMKYAVNELIIA